MTAQIEQRIARHHHINPKILLLVTTLLLVGASLSCASSRRIANSTVGYNLALEQAQNEVLLLNIVRAKMHRPMYLTGISKVTGSIKSELTSGLSIPFGHGSTQAQNTFSPSGTYSLNPTFDVSVLDTQEFMRGFLAPATNDTLAYYWDQGWPQEMLLYLFVREVRKTDPNGTVTSITNYPSDDKELTAFSSWVESVMTNRISLEHCETKEDLNFTIPEGHLGSLKDVAEAMSKGIAIDGEGDEYCISKTKDDIILATNPGKDPCGLRKEGAPKEAPKEGESPKKPCGRHLKGDESPSSRGVQVLDSGLTSKDTGKPPEKVEVLLRSPEAMLYYLGEIMRLEEAHPERPPIAINPCPSSAPDRLARTSCEKQVLFYAGKGASTCGAPGVEVKYENTNYFIPPEGGDNKQCGMGRSMHALSLVSQLIGEQKVGKDLPKTETVRVIGQ